MCGHLCLLSFYILFIFTDGASDGDACNRRGNPGVCRNLDYCQEAIEDTAKLIRPQFCGFSGAEAIVCCLDEEFNATAAKPPRCVPDNLKAKKRLPDNLKAKVTGRKAWEKCIEYQESLVYPCQKQAGDKAAATRSDNCRRDTKDPYTIKRKRARGEEDAVYGEFPHIVLLGCNSTDGGQDLVSWTCGGVLISDKFVITVPKCEKQTIHPFGPVRYIRLNVLNRVAELKPNDRWYYVSKVHYHPDHDRVTFFHDYILLETETTMKLDQYAVPACLPVFDNMDVRKAIYAGWVEPTIKDDYVKEILQKITLEEVPHAKCNELYGATFNEPHGIRELTQVCYGSNETNIGACKTNVGSGLVIENRNVHCMYTLIGMFSFNVNCGSEGRPHVFTKIADEIAWIESIVWP